jgi:hypothetical protein
MKLPHITIYAEEDASRLSPEKALWIAVIERAARDYCFFFEWLQQYRMHCDVAQQERYYGVNRNSFVLKAIAEYNRLRWFMFSTTPTPFNLGYIFEMLDQEDDLLENVRKLSKEQFALHLQKIQEAKMFPKIVEHILLTSDMAVDTDSVTLEFRQPSTRARMRIT